MPRHDLYNSTAWKRLRRLKLSESPLCEHCALIGKTTPAQHVDHIVGINDGGDHLPPLDGLQSLCGPCHSVKTATEQAGKVHIVKGVDPLTGKPVDPRHPFNAEKISQG